MFLCKILVWFTPGLLVGLAVAGCDGGGEARVRLKSVRAMKTSPTGQYRWLDIADQPYCETFRESYDYSQADVTLNYSAESSVFHGRLKARGLKPNFAYQIKLVGRDGTESSERIGLTGRWWRQSWAGRDWSAGGNLNNKGGGRRPSPNDETYFRHRKVKDPLSPTRRKYRFTGYLALGIFVTDSAGCAEVDFRADASYHVFWKASQRRASHGDGPELEANFQADPSHRGAYEKNCPPAEVRIFGEWERLPVGETHLPPGRYECEFLLTEESFHGSGGDRAGQWAAALTAEIKFNILPPK